jgi:two-component system, OmpR family, response regulator MprA
MVEARLVTIPGVRALVVDDERGVREVLRRVLTLDGYEVVTAEGGAEALDLVSRDVPDVVLLDVGMPRVDGLEVCRGLRRVGERVPILMLTARSAVSDRVEGLDVGADDYMLKPFDVEELKARLRALLRRSREMTDDAPQKLLSFAEIQLDSSRYGALVGDRFTELTRTEYQLLELFMLNAEQVMSHSHIYERVWGYDFGVSSNALRVYVGYLRRKLEDAGARQLIQTVWGVGYVLREL